MTYKALLYTLITATKCYEYAIVAVKLAAVKVKSLDEIKVEKEKPAAVEDQPKNKDKVNTVMYEYAMYVHM